MWSRARKRVKNDAVYLKDRVLFLASDWVICLSLGFVAVCVRV